MLSELKRLQSNPRFAKGLCLALVLCLLWLWSSLFRTPGRVQSLLDSAEKTQRSKQQVIAAPNIHTILAQNLFGSYLPESLTADDVKASSLDLELVGLLYSLDPKKSQALIKLPGGAQQVYLIGEQLPGSIFVKRILPDAVILEVNGSLESLSLPKNTLSFEPAPKPLVGK